MLLATTRRMRLWACAHAVDDLYQGLIPASVPYFVLDRHYSYLAASGLTLAATLGSSLPQPLFGLLIDRRQVGWMAGAGVGLAGTAAGLAGVVPGYGLVWTLLLLSGLGVAMFHPAAGKAAREVAGSSASAMSVFAAGGSTGFFLGPVLATPALVTLGVGAMALFIPPAVLVAFVLVKRHLTATAPRRAAESGVDRWRPFLVLVGVEVIRSMVFFGVNTFIELYWIRNLHAGKAIAGLALAAFLVGGVIGTVAGGRIADRVGTVRTVQWGTAAMIPALVGLRLCPGALTALVLAVAAGLAVNVAFAVLVKLGQDYLPTRPGTASGVTLGLAVSIGGLVAPAYGAVADARGPQAVLSILCVLPVFALLIALALPEPAGDRPRDPVAVAVE